MGNNLQLFFVCSVFWGGLFGWGFFGKNSHKTDLVKCKNCFSKFIPQLKQTSNWHNLIFTKANVHQYQMTAGHGSLIMNSNPEHHAQESS